MTLEEQNFNLKRYLLTFLVEINNFEHAVEETEVLCQTKSDALQFGVYLFAISMPKNVEGFVTAEEIEFADDNFKDFWLQSEDEFVDSSYGHPSICFNTTDFTPPDMILQFFRRWDN